MIILGIETSCDETSVALLSDGKIIASRVHTQAVHSAFGGVVPELASRAHLGKIEVLARSLFEDSPVECGAIDGIAVTDRPGLAGALLVGIGFALGLHSQFRVPITGVNHLEGHISSLLINHDDVSYPFLGLVVSGGHTAIYRVDEFGKYTSLGQTVDDAAGEVFDKVGKLLGFPYPAGRAIEQAAGQALENTHISFPVARLKGLDFSFSGLKTAVKYFCAEKGDTWLAQNKPAVCRGFQKAVVDALARNILAASEQTGIQAVGVAGGVACNGELRRVLTSHFGNKVFFPSPDLCTDNAAMIARAGFERFKRGGAMLRFPSMSSSAGL